MPNPFADIQAQYMGLIQQRSQALAQQRAEEAAYRRAELMASVKQQRAPTLFEAFANPQTRDLVKQYLATPRAGQGGKPSPEDMRSALQQYLQSGTLPGPAKQVVQMAIGSGNPAMIESVYNKVIPPVFGAGAYGIRIAPFTYTDASGATVTTPFTLPARGGTASPVRVGGGGMPAVSLPEPSADASTSSLGTPAAFGGLPGETTLGMPAAGATLTSHKIPPKDQTLVGQVQQLIPQLIDLRRRFQAIGPDRWNAARVGYLGVRYGKHGLADAEAQAVMQKAIQVESAAKAAIAAASGTRAIGFIQSTEGHVPSGWGDYNYNMGAIDTLLDVNGPYRSVLNLYGLTPARPVGESGGEMKIPRGSTPLGGGYFYTPSGDTIHVSVTP